MIDISRRETCCSMAILFQLSGQTYEVGKVAVLGGEQEMPWSFDRLYKVEITDALASVGLNYDDDFLVHLDITDVYGQNWDEGTFSHTTIIFDPAHGQ